MFGKKYAPSINKQQIREKNGSKSNRCKTAWILAWICWFGQMKDGGFYLVFIIYDWRRAWECLFTCHCKRPLTSKMEARVPVTAWCHGQGHDGPLNCQDIRDIQYSSFLQRNCSCKTFLKRLKCQQYVFYSYMCYGYHMI